MTNFDGAVTKRGSRLPAVFGSVALLSIAGVVLAGCEAPVSIDDDVSATLPIGDETHHPQWLQLMPAGKGVLVPITHPAYDTFTFMIEGSEETIRVPPEVAEKYNAGDRVEVTYDRKHWKDGSTTISDVKVVVK